MNYYPSTPQSCTIAYLKLLGRLSRFLRQDHKFLGAKAGMVSILHTWGDTASRQQLWLHPHETVRRFGCIVPGGGVTKKGKWKSAKYQDKYLFPKRAMSKVFRAKFMAILRTKIEVPQSIGKQAFKTPWVVYAKQPFASPKTVVEYLGRYTHKVAISNHRLLSVSDSQVSFSYKDYRDTSKKKVMCLNGTEFLRRYVQHILPHGYIRIRYYGFLASKNKSKELNEAKTDLKQDKWEKTKLSWQEIAEQKLGIKENQCPHCKELSLRVIQTIEPLRGPPKGIKSNLEQWK